MQKKPTLINNIKNTKKLICTSAIALAGLTNAIEVNAAVHWEMEAQTASERISDSLIGSSGPELMLREGASVSANGNSASGNALYLDGVDDYALIAHSNYDFDHTNVRVELAAKADDPTATGYVFDRWGQLVVKVTEDGFALIAFYANGGSKSKTFGAADFDSSQWNHLTVEIVGETLKVFINDVQVGTIALDGGLPASPSKTALYIGKRGSNSDLPFAGYIDKVRITDADDIDGDDIANDIDDDIDGDGEPNATDDFPLDKDETLDTDNDGTGNNADDDDDGDGVLDTDDAFPLDNSKAAFSYVAAHWSMEAQTESETVLDSTLGVSGPELLLRSGASVSADGNSASGNALYLDGVDDYAVIAHSNYDLDHSNVRIELTAKADPSNADGYVIDRWGQLAVRMKSDGFFITAFNANGGATQQLFTSSDWDSTQWNHFAVEIVGDVLTVFINHVQVGTIALDGGLPVSPTKDALYIGKRYSGADFFTGYIDEVKIIGIKDTDADGIADEVDDDDDGDGVLDTDDAFPLDKDETLDTDGDGVGDNGDFAPNDASETLDTDGDGVGDNGDFAPNDASESVDNDGDGVGDNGDAFPNDASETADTDGDGVGDNGDFAPNDASETVDSDGDGVGDNADDFPDDDSKSANTAPVITAPANIIDVPQTNAAGTLATESAIAAFLSGYTASDIDGAVTVAVTIDGEAVTDSTIFPAGLTTVTFTVTDSFGVEVPASTTVTVTDLEKPVITILGTAEDIDVDGGYVELGATVLDNVDGDSLTVNVDSSAVDTSTPGNYVVSYNVTDTAGNIALEVLRSISVLDVLKPMLTVPADITVDASDANGTAATNAEIVAFLIAATAIDDIDENVVVDVTINDAAAEQVDVFPMGPTIVTFTATDAANNTTIETAIITVADLSAPVITLLGDSPQTVALNGTYIEGNATALDNVDGDVTSDIDIDDSTVDISTEGSYTITYTVLDAESNVGTATRTVVVQDAAAPVVTTPTSITVEATSPIGAEKTNEQIAAFLGAATAEDAVDGPLPATAEDVPDVFGLGDTSVTFLSTDLEGYEGTGAATITVVDTTNPVITLNGESAVTLAPDSAYFEHGATATDIVDANVTVAIGGDTVDTSVQATYTITYTAVDNAGNPADNVTRVVTVQDASAPVITAPASITVAATDSDGTSISDSVIGDFLTAVTAIDDIDNDVTVTSDAPNIFPIGVTTVTFSATDSAGNIGTAQATVTVTDQTAPVITLTGGAVELIVGENYIEPGVSANDNVDGDITERITVSDTLDTSVAGTYTLTYDVIDAKGNTAAQVTRQVIVLINDSDGDGVIDDDDAFPNDNTETVDTDLDGVGDNSDAFPNDASEIADSDNDGTGDNSDVFPDDATETVDTDSDGTGDNADVFPDDATETADSDNDGTGDNSDVFPDDATETVDSDNDGTGDNSDVFPNDASETVDSDNDGTGDNSDVFPNDASETVDSDSDGTGDNADAFPDDASETVDTDSDGTGDNNDTDIDGDGVLNENDADDYVAVTRANDLDRDGIADDVDSDGVDIVDAISVIETALLAQIDSAISLDATAIDTDISADVASFISDALSGTTIAGIQLNSIVDGAIKRSGAHDLTVELTNAVGSVVSFTALVHITPKVSIPETVFVKANEAISFNLDLSGSAVSYPVTFNYRLETMADAAAVIEESTVTIAAGETIQMTLPAQSRGDYQVVFSEDDARNAALVGNAVTKIIAEENTPPAIAVALMSAGNPVTLLDETDTDAAIAIEITDVDMTSAHTLVVTLNGVEVLNTLNDVNNQAHVIALDAATLGAGSQTIVVVVTELDTEELYSTSATIDFNIVAALPMLAETNEDGSIADSDGDGVSDADEGFGDVDGDGIADYLDDANLMGNEQNIGSGDDAVTVSVDEGLTISVGSTLKQVESGLSDDIGVAVTSENFITVLEIPVEAQAKMTESLADVQSFLMPLIDFKITGARAGATVNMILPLPMALTAKTEYRKLKADGSLVAFDISNGNAIMSAMTDAQGDCPAADSDTWQAGLVAGNDCVKLAIVDGGANDDDGEANGVIVDPAVIVDVNSAPQVSLNELMSVSENTSVALNATVIDIDGDVPSFTWTQTAGQTVAMSGDDSDTLTFTAPNIAADETLAFTLSVSDGVNTTEETINVTLVDSPISVTASVDAMSATSGDLVTLTAIPSTEHSELLSYRWIQTGGVKISIDAADSTTATFTAPKANSTLTFEFTLTEGDKVITQSVSVESDKKDSGGSFGTGILMFLAGLVGLRRKVKRN